MFDNLNANVVTATEEDLESAFGVDEKDGKSKKDQGNKKPAPSGDAGKGKTKIPSSKSTEKTLLDTNKKAPITDFSEDDGDVFDTEEDENDDPEEEKVKSGKKKTPIQKVKDEEEDDNEPEEDNDTDPDEEEKTEDENDDDPEEGDASDDIKSFLKARADLLIEKGEWADFEGREDQEWDEESFAEMELQQRAHQRQQMREELLDTFGPYGKEIANYAANGGDPDKLIDIFKEQQLIENLSIESEEDQRAAVMKYETEFLNKKPERVRKYIDSLVADKELASYAKEVKELMSEALDADKEALKAEQEQVVADRKAKLDASRKKFQSDVVTLVGQSSDMTPEEKKQVLQSLTKFDKKLKNGSEVNDFYFKFEQFRKDLPNYLKLVRFVLNPDKFIKSIENNGKNKATEKAFKLAIGANKSKKIKSAGGDTSGSGKAVKTTFKLL